MNKNDNYNCLPFYTSIVEQNHRKDYAYGNVYPLIAPNDRLLPFQLSRQHVTDATYEVKLYNIEGELLQDITSNVVGQNGWFVKENAYTNNAQQYMDIIVCCNYLALPNFLLLEGRYYITIADGVNTWYSEVFTVVRNLENFMRITWDSIKNQPLSDGWILYEGLGFKYKNVLYFATELGKPEYPYEEEGENRDGYFFAEKQISSKTYKAVTTAPEYLCDCMRLIRLSDHVEVRDKYDREYACDTFLATPSWQDNGDIAEVVIEFTTATVVKHIGYYWEKSSGDYNNDYNNDYLT